jgi:hypothetical protein
MFTPAGTITPGSSGTSTVAGRIYYYSNGLPVGGATVTLQGPVPATRQTDINGQFTFSGLAPGSWSITPSYAVVAASAISALDASYVLQYKVGMRALSTTQLLACDVTGNGTDSAFDAALIQQYQVGLISTFPVSQKCGVRWVFVPVPAPTPNQVVTQPRTAGPTCQAGSIAFQPLSTSVANQDFAAVELGDCTGNWQPGAP